MQVFVRRKNFKVTCSLCSSVLQWTSMPYVSRVQAIQRDAYRLHVLPLEHDCIAILLTEPRRDFQWGDFLQRVVPFSSSLRSASILSSSFPRSGASRQHCHENKAGLHMLSQFGAFVDEGCGTYRYIVDLGIQDLSEVSCGGESPLHPRAPTRTLHDRACIQYVLLCNLQQNAAEASQCGPKDD